YLGSGHNRFAAASGPMAEEVADSSSQMRPADLTAIYQDLCSACHRGDGRGGERGAGGSGTGAACLTGSGLTITQGGLI
ncbi:MAG: hypothetical protein ACRET0_12210, partial [Steroidobacteraceae bacterium]